MARILITSGPTRQYLDPVRYLTNASSGRMGKALAEAALALDHSVVVVSGPVEVEYPANAHVVQVTSTEEMLAVKADRVFPDCANLLADSAGGDTAVAENRLVAKDGREIACALTVRQIERLPNPVTLLIAREPARDACLSPERRPIAEGARDAGREDLVETNLNFPSIIGQSPQIREVCSER